MTTYFWRPGHDGNANDETHWLPTGIPGEDDTAYFDSTDVHNCTWDLAEVNKVILAAELNSYTGIITIANATTIGQLSQSSGTIYQNSELTVELYSGIAGTFRQGADINIKDKYPTTWYHFLIDDSMTSYSQYNASAASPHKICSTSAFPTYVPRVVMIPADPSLTRDFCYCYLQSCAASMYCPDPALNKVIWFNMHNSTDYGIINRATPIVREPKLDVHFIEGRSCGRVYREGGNAGVCAISGTIPTYSFAWQDILNFMDSNYPVSFMCESVIVPRAYIESFRPEPRAGSLYTDFALVLIEAR